METMHFHIAHTKIFLGELFRILGGGGVTMNNLTPMKNCPVGGQGNLNWMPGKFG